MSGDEGGNDYEQLAQIQRLRAAIHYGVGQICEEVGQEEGVSFQRHFIAALAEAAFKHTTTMALDLELFAKHAKRSTINSEDVKLLVRKSAPLLAHITSLSEQLASTAQEKRSRKQAAGGRKKKAGSSVSNVTDNEDSNF